MPLKIASGKLRPFCLGLNVLTGANEVTMKSMDRHINGIVQDCSISSVLAIEIPQANGDTAALY